MSRALSQRPTLQNASESGTVERAGSALAPLRAVAMGDSTTAGELRSTDGVLVSVGNTWVPMLTEAQQAGPKSWFTYLCLLSGGRITPWYNAGVGSDTTTGMLARFQTDVLDKAPDVVFLGNAHNDFATTSGIVEATTRANIDTMVVRARKAGIMVVLVTAYPDVAAPYPAPIRRHNRWLKRYAELNRLPLVDLYAAVVDPASTTGAWKSGYSSDGVHSLAPAAKIAGAKALADLSGLLRGNAMGTGWLPSDNVTETNQLVNPLMMTDTDGDGLPDGWTFDTSGTNRTITDGNMTLNSATFTSATAAFTQADVGRLMTGTGLFTGTCIKSVESATSITMSKLSALTNAATTVAFGNQSKTLVTDPNVVGKLWKVTTGGGTPYARQQIAIDGVKLKIGDTIKFAGLFAVNGAAGAMTANINLTFTGASTYTVKPMSSLIGVDMPLSYFECQATIPAGCTQILLGLSLGGGTGDFSIGQWGLYNLSTL